MESLNHRLIRENIKTLNEMQRIEDMIRILVKQGNPTSWQMLPRLNREYQELKERCERPE